MEEIKQIKDRIEATLNKMVRDCKGYELKPYICFKCPSLDRCFEVN